MYCIVRGWGFREVVWAFQFTWTVGAGDGIPLCLWDWIGKRKRNRVGLRFEIAFNSLIE
ncbi:uncharacterized protein BO66DRAFT_97919 [Aspergillus aculeatinus CBS 121060]|uniref:Uncharacterized protein n=1 Tax=Aspergillus aculeatinus CBS 121060 TaxID=1448322 RepID=A0ACD1H7U3_9EURO|nr:hypothetical protein BO66DRAFT_97919 [Aspergillus aculeatinus CBS 121060]RAH69572.1 hypothetical protein BO66DRAFT_97919 [Aspergillus aculeatinus CBS 121060]